MHIAQIFAATSPETFTRRVANMKNSTSNPFNASASSAPELTNYTDSSPSNKTASEWAPPPLLAQPTSPSSHLTSAPLQPDSCSGPSHPSLLTRALQQRQRRGATPSYPDLQHRFARPICGIHRRGRGIAYPWGCWRAGRRSRLVASFCAENSSQHRGSIVGMSYQGRN
jgi:hypothetical protein